mmetsp:Transcript_107725/g.170073  ORF Transcript_107725/g.170073 Transcript_107725/m.170073 type:complete len:260 (+) Transcript_107725:319-1098(+)
MPRRLRPFHFCKLASQPIDSSLICLFCAWILKNRATCYEHVCASFCYFFNICRADTTVDLEPNVVTTFIDHLSCLAQLIKRAANELLSTEARVHRHKQNDIELVHDILCMSQGRTWVEHQACFASAILDKRQGAVDVRRCFWMKSNVGRAGFAEVFHNAINGRHHEMHIDWSGHTMVTECLANHRPDRQVWHIVVVHHIKVHHISTCCEHVVNLLSKFSEVCRQYRRSNEEFVTFQKLASSLHVSLLGEAFPDRLLCGR